jgi:putative spermidine/putrescine transport system permease protein
MSGKARMRSQVGRWRRLLWPPLIISALLFALPQAAFIWLSFHDDIGLGQVSQTLTLNNYLTMLTDPFYLRSIWLTIVLSAEATAIGLLLGFPTAYALARLGNWVTTLALSLILTTSLITIVIKLMGLKFILGESGVVNSILLAAGVIATPLQLVNNQAGVVIGLVQYTLPILTLVLFSVVQTIPRYLEEAAEIHGASRATIYARVILPLAAPGVIGGGLLAFNMSMGAFTSPMLLGGGHVLTMPVLIQQKIIQNSDYAIGAALATVLLVLVFLANIMIAFGAERLFSARARPR